MDNSNIYKYYLGILESKLFLSKDQYSNSVDEEDESRLIDFSCEANREYTRMVNDNERWFLFFLKRIVSNLFKRFDIGYDVPYFYIERNGRKIKSTLFDFVLEENGEKIGYSFCFLGDEFVQQVMKRRIDGVNHAIVIFVAQKERDWMDSVNQTLLEQTQGYCGAITIRCFFDDKFGNEEYQVFEKCVKEYNTKARSIVGLKMISMPTPQAICRFREIKSRMLAEEKNILLNSEDISEEMLAIINKNFYENKKYHLMVGTSDFADSFLSSEWYFGIHSVNGVLDQTGLITGYLKSVEQLLYDILKLSWKRPKERTIKKKANANVGTELNGKNVYIVFCEENEEYIDKTLGSLLNFIRYKRRGENEYCNQDLFDVDAATIKILIDRLYLFKDENRNDHLHKDNIYDIEEVKRIRKMALSLYVLILGSFSIQENDYEILGMQPILSTDTNSETELYSAFNSWASSVLEFDMPSPKEVKVIAFSIFSSINSTWNVCIEGWNKMPENRNGRLCDYQMLFSTQMINNFEWELHYDWEEAHDYLEKKVIEFCHNEDLHKVLSKYDCIVVYNGTTMNIIEKAHTISKNS